MSRRFLKKPQVERDLIDHYAFIARDKVEPAERFLRVAEECFERLAADPMLGHSWRSPLPVLSDVCVYPMPTPFRNYLIFYRPIDNGVEFLTVLHGARDLQTVLGRLMKEE